MTLENFKNKSLCVGGRHYSGTTNVKPSTTIDKNGNIKYMAVGKCSNCGRNKSQFYSAKAIEGSGVLKNFFKGVFNKALKPVGNKIIKNPARAAEIAMNLGMAGATKNPALILNAGADAGKFALTGKGVKGGMIKVGEIRGNGLYLKRS